jgi:hypothetical protein
LRRNPTPILRVTQPYFAAAFALASRDFWRAALFLWISPLRAERSSRLVATVFCAGVASADLAVFRAVRRAERCARLRTAAARDFRMFFLADAILGTKRSLDLR